MIRRFSKVAEEMVEVPRAELEKLLESAIAICNVVVTQYREALELAASQNKRKDA
jgi:hypothetical protein